MKKIVVLNSISLQLLPLEELKGKKAEELPHLCPLEITDQSPIEEGDEVVSYIGHPDTAACAGVEVCKEKKMFKPQRGEDFWVYQLVCPNGLRLPNGATRLPEGFKCLWVHMKVE